jgi:hypothetical protein
MRLKELLSTEILARRPGPTQAVELLLLLLLLLLMMMIYPQLAVYIL